MIGNILSTRVICIGSLLTVLYVFLSIQTSKKTTKKKQKKKRKEKLSRNNINQSKRSQNFAQAIGTRNKAKQGTKKKDDDEACVLCFSHPWMQQGNMRVCVYVCNVCMAENKTDTKQKETKQVEDVMRGRIGIECNTTCTSLPSMIG